MTYIVKTYKWRRIELKLKLCITRNIKWRTDRYGNSYCDSINTYRHWTVLHEGKRIDSALTINRAKKLARNYCEKLAEGLRNA